MALFFSDHKLVDFDDWFATFKNNKVRLELEDKTGVKAIRVMRFPDNKNHCMVVFEAPNRAAMNLIETDPRLHERFTDKSIFIEPPTIIGGYHVTDLEVFTPGEDPSVQPFWIKHDLVDYDNWYDHRVETETTRKAMMEEHGVRNVRLLQNIDDPNDVIGVVLAPNRDIIVALLSEPDVQDLFANREIYKGIPKIIGPFSGIEL